MNRRAFLRRALTGAVGAALLPYVPAVLAEPLKRAAGFEPLTFQGAPLVADPCARTSIYFVNTNEWTRYIRFKDTSWLAVGDGLPGEGNQGVGEPIAGDFDRVLPSLPPILLDGGHEEVHQLVEERLMDVPVFLVHGIWPR